jgi:hypothetical protein
MAVENGLLIPIQGIIPGTLGIKFTVCFNDSVWNQYVDVSRQRVQYTYKPCKFLHVSQGGLKQGNHCLIIAFHCKVDALTELILYYSSIFVSIAGNYEI